MCFLNIIRDTIMKCVFTAVVLVIYISNFVVLQRLIEGYLLQQAIFHTRKSKTQQHTVEEILNQQAD